jgi:hypothetical protein
MSPNTFCSVAVNSHATSLSTSLSDTAAAVAVSAVGAAVAVAGGAASALTALSCCYDVKCVLQYSSDGTASVYSSNFNACMHTNTGNHHIKPCATAILIAQLQRHVTLYTTFALRVFALNSEAKPSITTYFLQVVVRVSFKFPLLLYPLLYHVFICQLRCVAITCILQAHFQPLSTLRHALISTLYVALQFGKHLVHIF